MSMCRVTSCVAGRGFCYDQCILLAKLCKPLPALLCTPRAKLPVNSRYLLTSYFCILVTCDEKDILFLVLVLDGLVGLHKTVQLQLLQHWWLGHRLGLLWYWMVCLRNKQRSLCCLEIAPKYTQEFWTLLLTMRATPFLLRDSCPQ